MHFPSFSHRSQDKKTLRRLLFLLLPIGLLLAAFFLLPRPAFLLSEAERFGQFTDTVFRNELSGSTLNLHYTIADPAAFGLENLPVSLGDASTKARQQSAAVLENYLNTLHSFQYDKLTEKQQLTYAVFQDYLETELSAAPLLLYSEPLSPTLGVQAQLPVLLAEYSFRTKGDIEDYLCLLSRIPDYFSSILAFERDKADAGLFMSSDCALEVIRQCRDFIADPEENYLIGLFEEKIDTVRNLTADEKIAYKSRNRSMLAGYVVPAYEQMITVLAQLEGQGKNDKGLAWLPEGKTYYQYLVKSTVGDGRTIEEIEESIKAQMVADYSDIQRLAGAGSTAQSGGTSSASFPDSTASRKPALMLDDLRQKITEDFPLLPAVSCSVRYVHSSLQEYLSPAFYLTPAIDDYQNNVIYINPSSNYNDLELYTTLAHEGYPGHLYQSVFFCSQEPDLLRNILDVGGYTEGWATYVEMYSYSLWEEDPALAALSQKNRSFTLGLASLLDIGIHYHGYSRDEVDSFLQKLGFETSTAASLYQTILEAPANYLKYYVGYLNFCSLRDAAKEQQGQQFSLKEFHRKVLEAGPMPFYLLEKQVLKTD